MKLYCFIILVLSVILAMPCYSADEEFVLPDWVEKTGKEWRFTVARGTLVLKRQGRPELSMVTDKGTVAGGGFGFFNVYRIRGVVKGDAKYAFEPESGGKDKCVFLARLGNAAGNFKRELRLTIHKSGSIEYSADKPFPSGTYAISNTRGVTYYARDVDLRPSRTSQKSKSLLATRFIVLECSGGFVYSIKPDRPVGCAGGGNIAWHGPWQTVSIHWAEDFDTEFDRLDAEKQ
ncbi:hypothetical protein ACFLQR_04640 [Verrucomicrobiota bacterium]